MKIAVLSKYDKNLENEKKACKKIIQYLRNSGNEVLEMTPEDVSAGDKSLETEIEKACEYEPELIISCYFNNQSKQGCKIVYNRMSKVTRNYAIKIAAYIERLGFINRGAKHDSEIADTKCSVILIEPIL